MILVLNCGSQSVKYKVFDGNLKLVQEKNISLVNQRAYQKTLVNELSKIKNLFPKIAVIGHRVVHGGKKFRQATEITPSVLKELAKCNKLAPLHNPFNLLGIKISSEIFPKIKQVAVFDTGFYRNLPEYVSLYPLPEEVRKRYGFQRFGFHGISHEYAAKIAAEKMGCPLKSLKIITCHLGGGASITAIKNGQAVDTSMGFTPLEGLVMMARAGDLDPGVVLELTKKLSPQKTDEILNYKSGLKGICGSSDMRELLARVERNDKKAILALKVFVYHIQKYIGAYYAILGGCDTLVFTGAIGAGSKKIRQMVCFGLKNLIIKTKILVIEPNEELAIAKEILKI